MLRLSGPSGDTKCPWGTAVQERSQHSLSPEYSLKAFSNAGQDMCCDEGSLHPPLPGGIGRMVSKQQTFRTSQPFLGTGSTG